MLKLQHFITKKNIIITITLLILVVILLIFYSQKPKSTINTAYILQTSDTHGYIKHEKDNKNGGWLKLGNVIEKELEKIGGEDNCLLIDCGDTFQGSFEATLTKGLFAVEIINLLHYDIFIPGNHDFDYGINYFLHLISKLKADILASNIRIEQNTAKIKPWKLYDINSIKIAVIGMTSPYIGYWLGRKYFEKYSITSITEQLNIMMPKIIESKPDIIILALHHGLYNSKRFPGEDRLLRNIIRKFPEINLVLGGHTHQSYSGELVYPDTLFIQPGEHGSFLTKIQINVNRLTNEAPVIQTELIPITSKVEINNTLLSKLSKIITESNKISKKIITTLNDIIDSDGVPGENCKITELISKAIFSVIKVDAVMCTVLNPNKKLEGQVTYKDIYEVCPYEDTIMILTLNSKELIAVLNEQNEFKSKYRKKLGLYVLRKNKIQGIWNIDQIKCYFKTHKKIKVAFSSYDIAGAGNRYPILRNIAKHNINRLSATNISLREAVVQYLCSTPKRIK